MKNFYQINETSCTTETVGFDWFCQNGDKLVHMGVIMFSKEGKIIHTKELCPCAHTMIQMFGEREFIMQQGLQPIVDKFKSGEIANALNKVKEGIK